MSEKREFYMAEDGFVDGTWYGRGSPVSLTEDQARYLVLQGTLLESMPAPAPAQPVVMPEPPKETADAGNTKPSKGGDK